MPSPDSEVKPSKSMGNSSVSARAAASTALENGAEQRAEPEAMELPRRFERLTLLRQVARGGMGEVFLATSGAIEGAERACVVKIIRREHAEDRSFLARFLDEARIQSQLQHPGVAQVLEAATDSTGKPYVVVEYVEGRNLGEVRTRAAQLGVRIAWPDAVAIGVALADALAHVHERTDASGKPLEIVHRDLSPQNVMVGYGGDSKLIDFGTARGENRRCHTVAGIVFAKPGYVAPEVANNTPGAAPADLYALGVMLWELIAGRRFLSGDAAEHMAAVASGERNPTPLAQLVEAPRELDALIAKMTTTRSADRMTAREATIDLVGLLKRAPSLADGERSVRARIAHLMQRLYPAEPARSRAEFARLVATARKSLPVPAPRTAPPAMPPPSPEPQGAVDPSMLPGTRYRLGREIGRGAMGVVLEAFHLDLGRTVALKVLAAGASISSEQGQRFRSEARAIAQIDNENLVRMHDFGTSADGRLYYAMELLEGEPLDRHLARERGMDWREATRVGIQACRALEAAHAAGVIHRDIKPANLFLTRSGSLKLLDFGVAKRVTEIERPEAESGSPGVVVIGTPEYMAPEQAVGGAADERSDIYALGAVLYELLTGRLPHVGSSTIALLDAKQRKPLESLRDRAPQRGLPDMLDKTIQRALDSDPELRFQSAEEMRDALQEALREPEIARRRRRHVAMAAVGVMMLALGGAIAAGASRPEVRERAAAMAKPVLERIRGKRPVEPSEAPAAMAAAPAEQAPSDPPAGEAPAPAEEPQANAAGEGEAAEGAVNEPAAAGEETDEASEEESASAKAAEEPKQAEGESEAEEAEEAGGEQAKAEESGTGTGTGTGTDTGSGSGKDLEAQIAEAQELMKSGKKVKGFNQMRRIGRKHMKNATALKAWSEAAMAMKGWGEAHRVAIRWVSVDKGVEARLHLARMQRAVGKREQAIKTLSRLLIEHPTNEEARATLQSYQGVRVAFGQR
jgi:eukaryotic-like serine/threonine-protein kinase